MKRLLRTVIACLVWLAAFPVVAQQRGAPWYDDRKDLLHFLDDAGKLQPVKTPADWARRAAHVRANMELVMGPLPPPSDLPLAPGIDAGEQLRHYTRRHVIFQVEQGDRLTGWLLVPHGSGRQDPRPGIICLPGSSAPGKDRPAGLTDAAGMAYAHELAARGYVCLVLDYPMLHTQEYKTDPYTLGYASATMKGIVNHRRGVDLLQSLPEVDPAAIGVIGHSLGGHNALFLAIFDERVKAVVSSCGFNVFAKHNGGNVSAWSSRYYMPRIKEVYGDDPARIPFDFTEILAALAPRPVFVNAPLHDEPDFEVSGVRDCFTAAIPVYREIFQAEDRLAVRYPDAGHAFPAAERQAAYAFFDRHLIRADAAPADPARGLALHRSGVVAGPVEIPAAEAPKLGTGDFSLATWVRCDADDRIPGDLVSQYDPARKRGFHLTLKSNPGVTSNQANWRHLQFGIDDNRPSAWQDCGRPGGALFAFALATHEGALYAGTCEPGKDQRGTVYRHAGGERWISCGSPDGSNSVTALAVHDGALYAGTGKYRVAGSSLPESENTTLGGRIFRYDGGNRWTDCGQLPDTEAVGGLVVYRGRLHASSLYQPPGFFRYEGGTRWTRLPDAMGPDRETGELGPKRVVSLTVHDGHLLATSYDGGRVYRYDGEKWTDLGALGDNTQTYAFTSYRGRLHVATWPGGSVFRRDDGDRWTDTGRLGAELEVMGMMVHNGRLIGGTLPLAEVHAYDGDGKWTLWQRLDHTPDVKYRRAWTMAEHDGQVYCATLPSGKVYSASHGLQTSWDHSLSSGWRHVVAIKTARGLALHVDGERVSELHAPEAVGYQLDAGAPLRLGDGMTGPLNGQLADLRLYRRALTAAEIAALAASPPPP